MWGTITSGQACSVIFWGEKCVNTTELGKNLMEEDLRRSVDDVDLVLWVRGTAGMPHN